MVLVLALHRLQRVPVVHTPPAKMDSKRFADVLPACVREVAWRRDCHIGCGPGAPSTPGRRRTPTPTSLIRCRPANIRGPMSDSGVYPSVSLETSAAGDAVTSRYKWSPLGRSVRWPAERGKTGSETESTGGRRTALGFGETGMRHTQPSRSIRRERKDANIRCSPRQRTASGVLGRRQVLIQSTTATRAQGLLVSRLERSYTVPT